MAVYLPIGPLNSSSGFLYQNVNPVPTSSYANDLVTEANGTGHQNTIYTIGERIWLSLALSQDEII